MYVCMHVCMFYEQTAHSGHHPRVPELLADLFGLPLERKHMTAHKPLETHGRVGCCGYESVKVAKHTKPSNTVKHRS